MNKQNVSICHDINCIFPMGEVNLEKSQKREESQYIQSHTPIAPTVLSRDGEAGMKLRPFLIQMTVLRIVLRLLGGRRSIKLFPRKI